MKISSLIATGALALVASGLAQAETPTPDAPLSLSSSLARVQVLAELAQFKKGPNPWSTSYNPLRTFVSVKSHAQVAVELAAARNSMAAMNSEDSGSSYLAATREQGGNAHTNLAGTSTQSDKFNAQ